LVLFSKEELLAFSLIGTTQTKMVSMTPKRDYDVLPLSLYAAIGDGRSVALVGADGAIDWLCLPSLDSVPFLDRLIAGASGGRFSITPADPFTVERRYREDSNVLEQIFSTDTGRVRVTSSLNSGISGRLPWTELAQRIEGLEGEVTLDMELRIARRQDRATPWRETSPHGDVVHIDGIICAFRTSNDVIRTSENDDRVSATISTHSGSRSVVALLASDDEPLILPPIETIDARIDRTDQAWREWTRNLDTDGPYGAVLRRSALALKLLLFSPTGAIAAAATNGLPERIGGTKNYDYRYGWLRDAAYTIKAFLRVGAVEEAKAAFSWMTATIGRHEGLHIMYSLDGSHAPEQTQLDLPGYCNSSPVVHGNKAREQLQLGIYGDLLETAALFVEQGHILDLVTRRLLADLADQCADNWRRKDAGIWELEQQEHYTMSKLGCWTALDRAVQLAGAGQIDGSRRTRWLRERDHVRAWIDANCWSETKQAYTLHAGSEKLDAALLLATRFRFERSDRLATTRDAVRRELSHGALLYRYSGMEEEEGCFLACSFWLVEAYALLGDKTTARRLLDELLQVTGINLGLLNEQQDPMDGAMLGNMPQALSHLALIHAVLSLNDGKT
jgi:GH15 family glucan-1,4-alpha-glucosidase